MLEKGTGCVKITPAHDFNDYEVGKRHALPMINILTFDGDIRETAEVYDTKGNESDVYSNEIPAEFQKLERFAARKAVVAGISSPLLTPLSSSMDCQISLLDSPVAAASLVTC